MMDWLGTVSEFRGSFDSSRLEPPHRITLPRATWLDLLGYCQKHNGPEGEDKPKERSDDLS